MDRELIRQAKKSLCSVARKNDSGKRRYTLESNVEGLITLGGYCVSVSDPETDQLIGKIHPISFIEMMIESYSD